MKLSKGTVLASLLLLAVGVEALSALEWATYPYFPDKGLLFAKTDASVFSVLAPFSPVLLILLLYAWIGKLTISLDTQFSKRVKAQFVWVVQSIANLKPQNESNSGKWLTLTARPRLLLGIGISVALFLGVVPFRPELNPAMTPVGVDAHYYIEWVNGMLQRSPWNAISYAMSSASFGSRPLILIPMYLAVASGAVTTIQAVDSLPAILGPLLALSTFLFVREGQQSEKVAAIASLFSVFSFITTVGMWAGFFTNWLALVEAFLFFAVLLNFLRAASRPKFVVLILLSLALLLTHPWTGGMVLAVTTFLVLSEWRKSHKTKLVKSLGLLLGTSGIVYTAKSILVEGLATAQYTSAGLSTMGASQILSFWPNILDTLFVYYDGLLGNAVILGLSLVAVAYLRFNVVFERLLIFWVAIGSLLFPFFDSGLQTRIVYDLPFPVLTTLGLLVVVRLLGKETFNYRLALLLVLLLCANYTLKAVTNLVVRPF